MPDQDAREPIFEGRSWRLTRGIDLPTGIRISARFASGTLTGIVGADHYRADYRLEGTGLRIGPVTTAATTAATIADAPPERMARDFRTLLGAVTGYRTDEDDATLSLLDGAGVAVLVLAAEPAIGADLTGSWDVQASRIGDGLRAPDSDPPPYLAFDRSGEVTGSAGRIQMAGPARADADRLHLGPLMATGTGGGPAATDEESALLAALEEVARYQVLGTELVLYGADHEPLVRLTRSAASS
ncbi:MAG: META domain-containing protein [Candidatus Limnocylindrales bacterium]